MELTLVGLGCGTAATVTAEGREALERADCLIGARRLLEGLSRSYTQNRFAAVAPEEILALLEASGGERPCVVCSGDTGFYSGARGLLPLLRDRGIEARVLPGISSVQVLAARLGRPWQDWALCSAHGAACGAVAAVSQGRPAFFLTGGDRGPQTLCRELAEAGLGALSVTVGEDLSYPWERVVKGTAEAFSRRTFAPLSVLLAEAAPVCPPRTCGLADGLFSRGRVPMTKQEVRAVALGKLAVGPCDVAWDIGAGTGSVSVELALAARRGRVYAVECREEARALILENRARFCAWNLTVVPGQAPAALEDLPAPDAVFIGGTGGLVREAVDLVLEKNPRARVCVSAIALETLAAATAALAAHGVRVETAQIGVSRTKEAGELHLLTAQNPIFLITGNCPEGGAT